MLNRICLVTLKHLLNRIQLIDVESDTLVESEPDILSDSDVLVDVEPLVEPDVLVDVESESDVLMILSH